jgi:hypothetical protein
VRELSRPWRSWFESPPLRTISVARFDSVQCPNSRSGESTVGQAIFVTPQGDCGRAGECHNHDVPAAKLRLKDTLPDVALALEIALKGEGLTRAAETVADLVIEQGVASGSKAELAFGRRLRSPSGLSRTPAGVCGRTRLTAYLDGDQVVQITLGPLGLLRPRCGGSASGTMTSIGTPTTPADHAVSFARYGRHSGNVAQAALPT